MINLRMECASGANSWVLSPVFLIDRLLDHLEKLRSFLLPTEILPAQAQQVHLEQFDA